MFPSFSFPSFFLEKVPPSLGECKEPFKLSYYGWLPCIFSHSSWIRRHNLIYKIIEKNAILYSITIELCEYEMRKMCMNNYIWVIYE